MSAVYPKRTLDGRHLRHVRTLLCAISSLAPEPRAAMRRHKRQCRKSPSQVVGGSRMLSTRKLYSLIGIAVGSVISVSTAAHAQTTALRGARVIDGTGDAAIDNATIVIRDGRIVSIGPSVGAPVPGDAEVIDYAGKTIIPGLISAHSH